MDFPLAFPPPPSGSRFPLPPPPPPPKKVSNPHQSQRDSARKISLATESRIPQPPKTSAIRERGWFPCPLFVADLVPGFIQGSVKMQGNGGCLQGRRGRRGRRSLAKKVWNPRSLRENVPPPCSSMSAFETCLPGRLKRGQPSGVHEIRKKTQPN